MSILKEERGQFSYAFIFAIMIIVLLFIFMFIAPLLQAFLTGMYSGMEPVIEISKTYATGIDNNDTREAFLGAITSQENSAIAGNQVLSALIGFGGVFTVILVAFVFYLLSRRNVQTGQLG